MSNRKSERIGVGLSSVTYTAVFTVAFKVVFLLSWFQSLVLAFMLAIILGSQFRLQLEIERLEGIYLTTVAALATPDSKAALEQTARDHEQQRNT